MGELPGSRRRCLLRASYSDNDRLYPVGRMHWGEGSRSYTDFYSPSEIVPLSRVVAQLQLAAGFGNCDRVIRSYLARRLLRREFCRLRQS